MQPNDQEAKVLSDNIFPVVGIGASAGGLEAFRTLIRAIPAGSGIAYVFVQHLDPHHESSLPELLQKVTVIPVLEITDDMEVRPDHIYIIPSNKMLIANDGVLKLSPRPGKDKRSLNLPIDLFFTSLAEIHGSHAIGVVLSGTASDGTAGLMAIRERGGLTFAQDEASAAYDSMPRSAAQAGVVDFVLPPEEIVAKLLELKQQLLLQAHKPEDLIKEEETIYKQMLSLLHARKATDFTYYKRPTIRRRIQRRMAITQKGTASDYLQFLKENNNEQDALYQDLLIPVTAFFRDPKVFEDLCKSVFPLISEGKLPGECLRVWIAGCSTGEEAYSMAICLKEYLEDRSIQVQIFASDISEPAIAKARLGIYSKNEVAGVSPLRLQQFFTKTKEGYQVNKQVRELCVFAMHNFLKDPPFGKIDLLSCRNVLIYLEPYLQKKALTIFHYALAPAGYLLLGKSETSSGVPDLFQAVDKQDKLYTRKDVPGRFMNVASQGHERSFRTLSIGSKKDDLKTNFQKTADDILLSRYTPAGAVVNDTLDIIQFRGDTSPYLQQVAGKPTHNLLKLAKNGLAFELRNIIQKARKEGQSVKKENISLLIAGVHQMITIEAIPLPDVVDPHYLILFYGTSGTALQSAAMPDGTRTQETNNIRIQQVEKELAEAREDMRSITDDQEAANEELQSANEELLSGSEELQSLNEELETSKEELQSSNEELIVLNQELTSLNEQLNVAAKNQEIIRAKMEAQAKMTQELLMTAPAFVCTLRGPDHVYDMVNARYQQLFGKRRIKGKPIMQALPELEGQHFEKVLHDVYNSGVPYVGINFPLRLSRDEELQPEERYFNFSYQPMYDENRVIYSILAFGYEVTEQINAKNRIYELQEAHRKELEEKVAQRTGQLNEANEELLKRNEDLQRANKELESFAYVSSHDLQEPLRKIQTFTSHILSREYNALSPNGKESFQRIGDAASRMQILIQDLLAYSHANSKDRKFERIDLNDILTDVLSDLKDIIAEKEASIESSGLCEARISPFQFRQVMYNLISNALKFSKPGGQAHIGICCTVQEGSLLESENKMLPAGRLIPARKYCHISFQDNGIGFETEYSEKIFEIFQRLHAKGTYPGTGIGLAIVKKVIEHHDGMVTATGNPDTGATFDVYIPA